MTFSELLNSNANGIISGLDRVLYLDDIDPFFHNALNYKSEELAKKIYMNDEESRSLDEITADCIVGVIGEIAVAQLLFRADGCENFLINDESLTKEYHWDVKAWFDHQAYLFEVKHQVKTTAGFSFRHPQQCKSAYQNWRKWNFMVGFYITEDGNTVVPTSIVINSAFEKLYKNSQQDSGTYLQTGKATQQGLFYPLNINRRH